MMMMTFVRANGREKFPFCDQPVTKLILCLRLASQQFCEFLLLPLYFLTIIPMKYVFEIQTIMMKSEIFLFSIALFLCISASSCNNVTRELKGEIYSAFDSASWAVTSDRLSPLLGADKQHLYDNYINACDVAISRSQSRSQSDRICRSNDKARMEMNHHQPISVYNFTKNGYFKTRVPTDLFKLIKEFFDKNRHRAETEWKEYNVYHNAWESPPTIVHLQSAAKTEDGSSLAMKIEDGVKPILEEWTGQRLSPVSLFL